MKKNEKKLLLRDVVAQGPSKSRRIKNVDGFLFLRAINARACPPKTGAFPEHEQCAGVLVLSQRKGDNGCLHRQSISPGLTPTRSRLEGRQGAPSPRLVVMS